VISTPYPVNDNIYDVAARSANPVVFDIKSLDLTRAPLWLKLNYFAGAREMVIKVLPYMDKPKHSIILFSDKPGTFDEKSIHIIERISSQLSTAANNISANEEIVNKEKDTSSLLEFSNSLAGVRTKDDLEIAIINVLQNMLNIKLAMIRILDEDSIGLSPYMYDKTRFHGTEESFNALLSKKITIHEPISARVLNSQEPVIFNIETAEKNGLNNAYIQFWKKLGMKNAYGAALRAGHKIIGILWLVTDDLNITILKGICAQISIAISNIRANEQVLSYKQMLEVENDQLKEQIKTIYNFSDIIGSGPAMQKVYHLMELVAETNSTVLLLGETGTGKELIARAIHNSSPRKKRLMVKVNCAALPVNLIESELFGHEKGAFTGATERRIGKFELAHQSTLFLDEIGELPLELQVKLLRVIQEREFERLGGKTTLKVDVRIIAATNRNLEEEVAAGQFRQDLYYRLNVFPIVLPPLRERPEDIPPLASFFLARYSKNTGFKVTSIANKVMQELKNYRWPGNVRELEHLIERSILLAGDTVIREVDLPNTQKDKKTEQDVFFNGTLDDVERAYIIQILKRCSGKISGDGGAADVLDIPSTTVHSKIKKLGISKSDYFPSSSK
jgi:transcriptional regulator with GAF, ATPase, and Fis domain